VDVGLLTGIAIVIELLCFFYAFAFVVASVVIGPAWVVYMAGRGVLALVRRYRPDPVRDLTRAYVDGELTVEEFEERVAVALVTPAEPRHRLTLAGVAAIDVCLALFVLMFAHTALARVGGALLGFGALVALPRRTVVYAFVAGLALLAAPLAGIAFGASAAYRALAERRV